MFRKESFSEVMDRSLKRALGGGISGGTAMIIQVLSFMWLRTIMNYQYCHGSSLTNTIKTLYTQGGVPRFYKGLLPALFQGPLCRFGDTAANAFSLSLLDSYESTNALPISVKTAFASLTSGCWRMCLMPIDTTKTIMQVHGNKGIPILLSKFKLRGPVVFYHGAFASFSATAIGHFPWFYTFNVLDSKIPKYKDTLMFLARNGFIGFISSFVSDTVSNSARVIKTYKQTHNEVTSYTRAVINIWAKDGLSGLLGRGLKTRYLVNGLNGLLFGMLWKGIQKYINEKE